MKTTILALAFGGALASIASAQSVGEQTGMIHPSSHSRRTSNNGGDIGRQAPRRNTEAARIEIPRSLSF